MSFGSWLRQPTTIHGLGVLAAGLGASLSQVATGNPWVDVGVGAAAYALTHIGINDNSTASSAIAATVTDLVQGAPADKLISDSVGIVGQVAPGYAPIVGAAVPIVQAIAKDVTAPKG